MNNSTALAIVAGLMALIGGFVFLKAVRSIRAPRQYPGALMYWDEPAAEDFLRDPGGSLSVLIHRAALVALGVMGIAAMLRQADTSIGSISAGGLSALLTSFILVCAAGLIGLTFGVSLFGPLAERLGGHHHYAVSAEGILIGNSLLPWSAFSRFDLDAGHNLVRIWSATLPASPGMVASPSQAGAAVKLADILRNYLPEAAPGVRAKRGRWTLPGYLALLCLPFVALGWWLSVVAITVALAAYAVLMWALQLLGAWLIAQLLYGNKARPTLVGTE